MNNKFILESLASDLKRVALGFNRGSDKMAQRFLEEALKRRDEVEIENLDLYIKKLLMTLDNTIDSENALMYSTLIQNYTMYKKF